MPYQHLLTSVHGERPLKTGLVQLHRPQQMNALNDAVMNELGAALLAFDRDESVGCIVLTGTDKAFAAGADIAEMADYDFVRAYTTNFVSGNWETLRHIRKPVIAAVAGYALGGGCEVAMMADFIIAADTARFGQPEITVGIVPGAGGTQRLPRAVGKAKAMDMVLTGRTMDAVEAERAGLVSRVVAADDLMQEALAAADTMCGLGMPSLMLAKECVARAFESPLSEGLAYERRTFHAVFGTEDQREGMDAFLAKRTPRFKHR